MALDFLDRFALDRPLVLAGMAGGVAGGELAGTVSAAGALGTVGMMAPRAFAAALQRARGRAPCRAALRAGCTRRAPASRHPAVLPFVAAHRMRDRTVDSMALYAGETVDRLHDVIPAAEAVDQLTRVEV